MKQILLTILIVLSIVLVLISSQINLSENIFSTNNINCLFGILVCGFLFYAAVLFFGKIVKTERIAFFKSKLIFLLIFFALLCYFLIVIAYSKVSLSENLGDYLSIFSYIGFLIAFALLIRNEIRQKRSENK